MPKPTSGRGVHRLSLRLTDAHWEEWNRIKSVLSTLNLSCEQYVMEAIYEKFQREHSTYHADHPSKIITGHRQVLAEHHEILLTTRQMRAALQKEWEALQEKREKFEAQRTARKKSDPLRRKT